MTARVDEADEVLLRSLTPSVLGILVRRGADFAAAEDAVQESLLEALRAWRAGPPEDPKAWLVTVAWRKFLDAMRADASRRGRRRPTGFRSSSGTTSSSGSPTARSRG